MRKLVKLKEPVQWQEFRLSQPTPEFEGKDFLRTALLKEQGYLCAYCMRRIPVHGTLASGRQTVETSKIEHVKCQEHYPHLALDYQNLVVCCPGSIAGIRHCDTSKENKEISFDLFSDDLYDSLSYESNGRLVSSDKIWQKEIDDVLNLNMPLLKSNRKAVLDAIRELCARYHKKTSKLSRQWLLGEIAKWDEKDKEGKYKEYSGVVVNYLMRKLARC